MAIVGLQLSLGHASQLQMFTHQIEPRGMRILRHITRIEVVYPLFQRSLGHLVKIIDFQDIVFRIQIADHRGIKLLLLERCKPQQFTIMNAAKLRLAMIDDVGAIAQREIDDINRVNLFHMTIVLPSLDILRHQFGSPKQHPLEVSILAIVLNLYQKQMPLIVLGQNVHAVVLIVLLFLVALTLQQFLDTDGLAQQRREESLQHSEVGLVAQQTLHGPVKSYIIAHNTAKILKIMMATNNLRDEFRFFNTAYRWHLVGVPQLRYDRTPIAIRAYTNCDTTVLQLRYGLQTPLYGTGNAITDARCHAPARRWASARYGL